MNRDIQSTDASPAGLFGSVKNLPASLVSHLHTRLLLFATEFFRKKLRLTSLLLSAILSLFYYFEAVMEKQLSDKRQDGFWNSDDAKTLVMFCDGFWCGQSPT